MSNETLEPAEHPELNESLEGEVDRSAITNKLRSKAGKYDAYKAARKRRDAFVQAMIETGSIPQSCARVGVVQSTYKKWRVRWPDFAAEVDSVRLPPEEQIVGWSGGFAAFRKRFFKMDSTWFHLRIVNALENSKPGTITLILIPPEHGKTTLLEDYCNFKLALDPTFRITVGSEQQTHSRKVLRRVRNRMEPTGPAKEYVLKYGPFIPREAGHGRQVSQPWSANYFDVFKKGQHDERDYSMVALGMGSAIAGTRTDLLLIDDPQSLKSLSQTEKLLENFRQDWLSRPGNSGKTVIIMTRVGDEDFANALIEADLVDDLIIIPAQDQDGKWLWPERYSAEDYERKKRQVGDAAWARNYMQAPTASGEETFEPELLEKVKNSMRSIMHPAPLTEDGLTSIMLSIDPAIGGGNGLLAAAATPGKLVVLDGRVDWGFSRNEQIWNVLEDYLVRFNEHGVSHVTDVIIEAMAFQKGLLEDDGLIELQERYGFTIRSHLTGYNKYDENLGIAAMAMSFRRDEVEIPWAEDELTRPHMEPLLHELSKWRPYRRGTKLVQNRVMTLWFAWLRWRLNKTGEQADPSQFATRGLPYAQSKVLVGRNVR